MAGEETPPQPRRRRRFLWWSLGALSIVLIIGVWLVLGLVLAAQDVRREAATAQQLLSTAATALTDGDVAAARAAVEQGGASVSAAAEALERPQVRLVAGLPVVGGAVDDARALASAAGHATAAAAQVTEAYAAAAGADGGDRLFTDGAVSEPTLDAVLGAVVAASAEVDAAQSDLDRVEATAPGTDALAQARDTAQAELAGLQGGLSSFAAAAPAIPTALGFDGPRTYVLGILNSAELRASGGPPLAAALLRFDQGRFTIIDRGQTGVVFMLDNPRVKYRAADGSMRYDRFINATADADFRSAGVDLARSWEASTGTPVDGVITMDAVALAALLDTTGPIEVPEYGQITGETFIQAVLVDAYEAFAGAQRDRQAINALMIDELASRLTSGDQALPVMRTLGATAPGRHIQIWMADPRLEEVIAETPLGGAVADPSPDADRVGVFSQNVNRSKVDVFQERAIDIEVHLAANGSAAVQQDLRIANDPPSTRSAAKRRGYKTGWSRSAYRIYVPDAADGVRVTSPDGAEFDVVDLAATDSRGRRYVRVDAWIPPSGVLSLRVTYTLPPGTFGGPSDLRYLLRADPQALVRPVAMNVELRVPAGYRVEGGGDLTPTATGGGWQGTLDRPVTLSAEVPHGG